MLPFNKAWKKDTKLANYKFSAVVVNQLQSKREWLLLATLEMYAGLWKHCMVILSFISFIVLISAFRRGVLNLIWSEGIVFGIINLCEVLTLTSQLLPPLYLFLWNSLIPGFLCLYRQHNSNQRKTKDEGKNSRRSYLHGLSIFHKHKAQMTSDHSPRTCLSSRMSAPFVSVVVGYFLSLGCILVPRDKGSTYTSTSGICIRKD